MEEIIVKSQAELDALPTDYDGRIYIEFGTPYNRAVVKRRFKYSVVAWGNSSVVAWGNSSVEARKNSSVEARENSSVVAWENSSVEARENSSVVAWENSSVVARENSSVEARGNSSVEAWGNSSVVAWENSSVEAWKNSSVEAWENSSVEARGNSSVEARGNAQVVDEARNGAVSVSGNARIVYNPRNISEYLKHHGIDATDGKTRLYKAVHKKKDTYVDDRDSKFTYTIGEEAHADKLDTNNQEDCGNGIHMAYKEWCVDYGREWEDLAILEVEAEVSGIVVPLGGRGKVRAEKVLVLREVPLEECGLLGKILAKRMKEKT